MQAILGTKIDQTQKFLDDGTRIPVTRLWVAGNTVVAIKSKDKHDYSSLQLGLGIKKNASKALVGHIKGANLESAPKFLREVKVENGEVPEIGAVISATEIFKLGDIVDVTGVSKGKGYAGVVKRHHFKGGPRTHGQSDRERAPGSIGQTTTPGRVYKGKRMAGRMGHERVTIKNLEVVGVSEDTLLIKGLVPGGKNTLIMVTKVGENKKFVPLYGTSKKTEEEKTENKELENTQTEKVEASASQPEENGDSRSPQISGDARQAEDKTGENSGSLSEIQTPEVKEKQEGLGSNLDSPETGQTPIATKTNDSSEEKESKEDKESAS
ncbi:MAG: 50S ribosomal protein L3 [Candidatus Levybacteria bacterium]|nr:50S ribosomal protein L3 [Candidatus Levybacteria bacterium]